MGTVSETRYYLAPMEGITGYVFRNVYHSCFPAMDKYFTPFLSPNQNGTLSPKEYRDVRPDHNEGMHVVPQILTNRAEDFIATARLLKKMGYDEVNLNLGCPSNTVVSKGRGSGFLASPEQLDRCLYQIFSGLDMKISVKTRIGKESPDEFERLLSIYNRYHMEELIIHPRIQKDMYRNVPRMDVFARAWTHSLNPVCYNGDIFWSGDAKVLKERFPSLSAVMLGRGIIANPGLLLTFGQSGGTPELSKERLKEFHDRLYEANRRVYLAEAGPKVVLFKMKEVWCYLITSFEDSEKPGKKIKKAQTLQDYEAAVSALFQTTKLTDRAMGQKGEFHAVISGN